MLEYNETTEEIHFNRTLRKFENAIFDYKINYISLETISRKDTMNK